jgi:hypothetical protein
VRRRGGDPGGYRALGRDLFLDPGSGHAARGCSASRGPARLR